MNDYVIYSSPVSDQGIKHLRELPNLRKVQLSDVKITTACVPTLNQLTELEELYILNNTGANVTKDQLPNLRKLREWKLDF